MAFAIAAALASSFPIVAVAAEADVAASDPIAQAQALSDVPPGSPAYRAIQDLERAGIIQGYPDGTFKGNRLLTRYEAAAIIERAVLYVQNAMRNPATAQGLSAADVAALRALLAEFKPDIDSLNRRVDSLNSQLTATTARVNDASARLTEAERSLAVGSNAVNAVNGRLNTVAAQVDATAKATAATASTLDRQQLHFLYFMRAPGAFGDEVAAYNAAGVALAPGTLITNTNNSLGAGGNTGRNTLVSGVQNHGFGYQTIRAFFDGNVDKYVSYHFRLEDRYYFSNASANDSGNPLVGGGAANTPLIGGSSSTAPNYCSSAPGTTLTTCGTDYPTNSTFRINYVNVQYKDAPNGYAVTAGRYFEQDPGLGLGYADYFNGALFSWSGKGVTARAGYSFNFASLSNGAAAPSSGQSLLGSVAVELNKRLTAGLTYVTDINPQLTLWNTTTQAYAAAPGPLSVGTAFANWKPTPMWNLQVEGAQRFGNDPFLKTAWTQAQAVWAQGQYGSLAAPYGTYVEGGLVQSGFNALGPHTNLIGTTNYEQPLLANPNGYRIGYAGLHHYLGRGMRLGLEYVHYDIIPGTIIPASATTYIAHDIGNAVFLQTLVQF